MVNKITGAVAAMVFVAGMLVGCSTTDAAERPLRVPKGALWIGGADGGVFVTIALSPDARKYSVRVFDDYSGEVLFQGQLVATAEVPTEVDLTKAETFLGWDSNGLHIKAGGVLRPMK